MQLKSQATLGLAGITFAQNPASSFNTRYSQALPEVLPRGDSCSTALYTTVPNSPVLDSLDSSSSQHSPDTLPKAHFSAFDNLQRFKQRQARLADQRFAHRGFTLVELLVVVTLMAILAAGVVLAMDGVEDDAKLKLTKVEMSELRKALIQFKRDVGHFPQPDDVILVEVPDKSIELLITCSPIRDDGCNVWNIDTARGWNGPYILTGGLTDSWGNRYQLYDAETGSARIVSFGPDKTLSSAGVNAPTCETSSAGDDIVLCLRK